MRKILAMCVTLVAVAVLALAQVPPPTPSATEDKPAAEKPLANQVGGLRFVGVTEVTVVEVNVSVSTKNGPVLDLKPQDFEVFQDGKPQEVTNFALFTMPTPQMGQPAPTALPVPATPTPAPAPAPPRREPRYLVLYIDNENILPMDRNRVFNRLIDWVGAHLVAPDQAMVVAYQKSFKIVQPFTSDPDEIADALRSLKTYTGGRSDAVSERRDIEDFIEQNKNDASSLDRAAGQARSFAREQRNNLMFTVHQLRDFVASMSGLPGKKAILYVSDGLPMTPGLELYYQIQDSYSDPSIISESREFDSNDLYRSLVTASTAAGVTLYTIDARGLESELGIEAENRQARSTLAASIARTNYQDSLVYMADQTGGMAIINSNDVGPGLEKVAADFQTYYSLGYHLVPSGYDRMHRVEVRIKGHPEYALHYQRQFIEKSLPTRIGDRVMSGLAFDVEQNDLGISVSTEEPTPASNGRWLLPVKVDVPIEKIALVPDGNDLVGYLMVYYAARDDGGKQSDLQHTEAVVRIPEAKYEQARRQTWAVENSLLLDPGRYRISVGARDQLTNQAGFAALRRLVHPELK